ncbi:hypothetical protein NC651_012968 [Populus alba x Populus x berolinensis]|nr:hypothetical protein NC651_012968 [Populus alba x Populus x berolinensis]
MAAPLSIHVVNNEDSLTFFFSATAYKSPQNLPFSIYLFQLPKKPYRMSSSSMESYDQKVVFDFHERYLDQGNRFHLQELDVLSDESVQNVVSNVVERYGRVDILVSNAGIQCVGPLAEIPLSATQNTSDPNVFGHFVYGTLEFLSGFRLQR